MQTDTITQCSKGWGRRCACSKGRRCRCACGGQNHGNPAARAKGNAADSSLEQTPERVLRYQWDEERKVPSRDVLLADDERIIKFVRTVRPGAYGDVSTAQVYVVDTEGEAQLARRYVKHSPTGFEWGYGGSGPADTALNILALIVPVKEAAQFYQSFKFAFVASVPRDGGEIRLSDVRRWLAEQYEQQAQTEVAS